MVEIALQDEIGYVDSEGRVYIGQGDDATLLGQVPNTTPEAAREYFSKKYTPLESSVSLNEQRIKANGASAKEISASVEKLKKNLEEAKAYGDLEALKTRVAALESQLETLSEEEKEQRAADVEEARGHREGLVKAFEEISSQDPSQTHWKNSTDKINQTFDQWKSAQKNGPRLPKKEEDELWQRVKKARNHFDKNRRAFYAEQDKKNADARKVKTEIIERAKALQDSTDWADTAKAYKKLMDEWKASPRVQRKEDDKLWAQFREAQQTFFDNKRQAEDKKDEELSVNIEPKTAIVVEAEALLPVENLDASRKKFKEIVERYEEAGMVPREAQQDLEKRMRSVEKAHKDAETKYWRDNDPEKAARGNAMITQLNEQIEKLEADINATDESKRAKLEDELATKKSWLAMLQQ